MQGTLNGYGIYEPESISHWGLIEVLTANCGTSRYSTEYYGLHWGYAKL